MPKGLVAELKKKNLELAASTMGSTKSDLAMIFFGCCE
jgi:hypothetical protein